MLKKFGYTNLALLVAILAVPFFYFDENEIGMFQQIYFGGVAIVVLIHFFRVIVLIRTHRGE